jgi:hypothetical protein
VIALSRARTDPATRAYLERKHAEGKTKLEAIRCLKRHLARHFWRLLYTTPPPTARPPIRPASITVTAAPAFMPASRENSQIPERA